MDDRLSKMLEMKKDAQETNDNTPTKSLQLEKDICQELREEIQEAKKEVQTEIQTMNKDLWTVMTRTKQQTKNDMEIMLNSLNDLQDMRSTLIIETFQTKNYLDHKIQVAKDAVEHEVNGQYVRTRAQFQAL
jgi:hypothetical protein